MRKFLGKCCLWGPQAIFEQKCSCFLAGHIVKGQVAEDRALRFFLHKGYKVVARNQKFWGVEVDLLLNHPNDGLCVVEVKSLSRPERWHYRLSYGQKKRLLRVQRRLIDKYSGPVDLQLALVTLVGEVFVAPIVPAGDFLSGSGG